MTDQQSFNTISAHADLYDESYSSTPNIDRLVNSGISFTRSYCSNPVSVPSRFALFTGKYGGQYKVRENQSNQADEQTVRAMLATNGLGNVFTNGGYDTYYGGKIHLPFSGKAGRSKFAQPVAYGFDNYFTKDERQILALESAKIIDAKAKDLANGEADKPFLLVASFLNPHDICIEGSTNLSEKIKDEDKEDEKTKLKVECIRNIRENLAKIDSVDFYNNIAPDLPYNFAKTLGYPDNKNQQYKNFPDYYWRKYRWVYSELVSIVDQEVGVILDAIDRNPELKENTIIVFTSDHGEMQGAHQTITKSFPYEECQRVPFIFAGPGIKAGLRDNSLVCNGVDLLPTLCELANIEAPQTDGLSLASRMEGKDKKKLRDHLYLEGDRFLNVVSLDDKYTIFDHNSQGSQMLINLKDDKGELVNIIDDNNPKAEQMKKYIPLRLDSKDKKNKKKSNKKNNDTK